MTGLIIGGIVVVLVLAYVGIYNNLIKKKNWVEESFSQIDVQLQRRNDLIPNLVETVKGYAKHEAGTLTEVTQARQQLMQLPADATPEQINHYSNLLSTALARLVATAEAYPELKANTNFVQLQGSLEETENKIATARQLYNSSVGQFNRTVQSIPNNIVAAIAGFQTMAYLQAPEAAKEVPQVSFD